MILPRLHAYALPPVRKPQHVVSSKPRKHSSRIRRRSKRDRLTPRILVKLSRLRPRHIDHKPRRLRLGVLREHSSTPFCWNQLRIDPIPQKSQAQAMRRELRILRPVRSRPRPCLRRTVSTNRQKRSMSIVPKPRTQLVGRPKPLDPPVRRHKHPGRVGDRLQRPMRHAKRHRRNRQRVPS